MLKAIAKLFQPLPVMDQITSWALHNQHRCSPDEIIAAAVIQSMAKDISTYSLKDFSIQSADRRKDLRKPTAELRGPKVIVVFERSGWIRGRSRDGDGIRPWRFHPDGPIISVVVDGIPIKTSVGVQILSRYRSLSKVLTTSQQVAAKVKADMDRNEKAWNLAESLLGMKRNEFGALVPVQTVEG